MAEVPAQYRGLRPWRKGESGNPSGTGKARRSLQDAVRRLCGGDDGHKLAQFLADVCFQEGAFRGKHLPVPVRLEAARELAQRGWGRVALTNSETDNGSGFPVTINFIPVVGKTINDYTPEQIERLSPEAREHLGVPPSRVVEVEATDVRDAPQKPTTPAGWHKPYAPGWGPPDSPKPFVEKDDGSLRPGA